MNSPILVLLALLLTNLGRVHADSKGAPVPGRVQGTLPCHEKLNATLYLQTAAEYEAVARQTFVLAAAQLRRGLMDPTWVAAVEQDGDVAGLPPAVILDVDETILANPNYQAQLIRSGKEFSRETWNAWCASLRSTPIPGALAYCREADRLGVKVFYLTNRRDDVRDPTLRNLRKLGFPVDEDGSNLITNNGVLKTVRRAEVARDYRIVQMIGDNLADFLQESKSSPDQRAVAVRKFATWWGNRWFMLPNSVYGDWENSLIGFDLGLPRSTVLQLKNKALEE